MHLNILRLILAFLILSGASGCLARDFSEPQEAHLTPATLPASLSGHEPVEAPPPSPEPAGDAKSLRAQEILSGMTQKEKIAQMFLVYFQDAASAELAQQYGFGGYLLFSANFDGMSEDAITQRIALCQDASKIKMLIGVDEEGGGVNRVSVHPQLRSAPFKSPQSLMSSGGLELVKSDAAEKSRFLKSLGINFNLAPVCDVSTNPGDFIYYRTTGRDAKSTAEYVETVVSAMNEEKIAGALKHFPGYGNNGDTHTGLVYDNRDYDTFLSCDFLPFIAGIRAGVGCVMVSHNVVSAMDANKPASLSPEVHRILRSELGFDGVIMTDDLYMGAITSFVGSEGAAVQAILAGNDLLCCWDYKTQIAQVENAVSSGAILEATIDESVLRILKWKLTLDIIE